MQVGKYLRILANVYVGGRVGLTSNVVLRYHRCVWRCLVNDCDWNSSPEHAL